MLRLGVRVLVWVLLGVAIYNHSIRHIPSVQRAFHSTARDWEQQLVIAAPWTRYFLPPVKRFVSALSEYEYRASEEWFQFLRAQWNLFIDLYNGLS